MNIHFALPDEYFSPRVRTMWAMLRPVTVSLLHRFVSVNKIRNSKDQTVESAIMERQKSWMRNTLCFKGMKIKRQYLCGPKKLQESIGELNGRYFVRTITPWCVEYELYQQAAPLAKLSFDHNFQQWRLTGPKRLLLAILTIDELKRD